MIKENPDPGRRSPLRSWLSGHRVLALLGVNLVLAGTVAAGLELALRVFPPAWLPYRVARLEAGAPAGDFGSDHDWKVLRREGRFVSFIPGAQFKVLHKEFQATATIDELGGRQVVPRKAGKPIVGCLGDSFTFGVGVADEQTFVSRLQGGVGVRLLNLGVPGGAFPQQRWIVEQRHEELGRPRLYVLFFFLGNDFDDMLRTRRNAYATEPDQPAHPVVRAEETLARSLNSLANRSILRHSYAFQFSKQAVMALLRPGSHRYEAFRIMDVKDTAYQEEARNCLESELDAFQALAMLTPFKLLVVFVPDRYQIVPRRKQMQARYYGIDEKNLDPAWPNRLLAGALARRGIPYIDPTASLQAAEAPDSFYYVNDNHFTGRGHAAFAEAIANEFSARIRELSAPARTP